MTLEIIDALGGYLKTLYDLNHKLIKLCGVDTLYPFDKTILDIIQDIVFKTLFFSVIGLGIFILILSNIKRYIKINRGETNEQN